MTTEITFLIDLTTRRPRFMIPKMPKSKNMTHSRFHSGPKQKPKLRIGKGPLPPPKNGPTCNDIVCHNNGLCVEGFPPRCLCASGFKGKRCEQSKYQALNIQGQNILNSFYQNVHL